MLFRTIAVVALCATTPALAEPQSFKLDPQHTNVMWGISHFGYSKMLGRFNVIEGSFTLDEQNVGNSKVDVSIKTDSVDTKVPQLDTHLKSPDFFNAAAHPTITFKSTSASKTGEKTGKLTGDLTINGVTKPVTLDVTLNKLAPHPVPAMKGVLNAGFSATAKLNRHDFNVSYGRGAIGDEVTLLIEAEGQKM
jgi:polyisoprenoid-binding protein YceI